MPMDHYVFDRRGWGGQFVSAANLFSRLKALYSVFISLACDVFLCFVPALHDFYLFWLQTLCRDFVFVFANQPPSKRKWSVSKQ